MKNFITKLTAVLVAAVMALALFGCTSSGGQPNDDEGRLPPIEHPDVPDYPDPADLLGQADTSSATGVVTLLDTVAQLSGLNVTAKPSTAYGYIVEITKSGTYVISGVLREGFVAVANKGLDVTLVLNGVYIASSCYAPIVTTKNSNINIILAPGSTNYLVDGTSYNYGYDTQHMPSAALYSRLALTIDGTGSLEVHANQNNGIGSKSDLVINGGDITVYAVGNALKGNDHLTINGGDLHLSSSRSNAVRTDPDALEGMGNIYISGGTLDITSALDGIDATTDTVIDGGTISVFSYAKAIRARRQLTINGGDISILHSDEGLEAESVRITDGTLRIQSIQNGINISGQDLKGYTDGTLTISGGAIYIDSFTDGIDSNGNILMTDGLVVISTQLGGGGVAIDYQGTFGINGGTLVALSASTYEQQPDISSTQQSVMLNFGTVVAGDTLLCVMADSAPLVTLRTNRATQSIVLSTPDLTNGSYSLYRDGTCSADPDPLSGIYYPIGTTYTPGTLVRSFAIKSSIDIIYC